MRPWMLKQPFHNHSACNSSDILVPNEPVHESQFTGRINFDCSTASPEIFANLIIDSKAKLHHFQQLSSLKLSCGGPEQLFQQTAAPTTQKGTLQQKFLHQRSTKQFPASFVKYISHLTLISTSQNFTKVWTFMCTQHVLLKPIPVHHLSIR